MNNKLNYTQKRMLSAYQIFFNEEYRDTRLKSGFSETHIKMQNMCFLLESTGIYLANFGFAIDRYGVYSPGLLSELRFIDKLKGYEAPDALTEKEKEKIKKFRKEFEIEKFNSSDWMEYLGAMVYTERIMCPGEDFDFVQKKLNIPWYQTPTSEKISVAKKVFKRYER